MDKDPETLEEAIEQIKQWRELYCVKLQENGFGFPCNICRNNRAPVEECRDCVGYSGPFVVDKSDIAHLMERRDNVDPHTENSL